VHTVFNRANFITHLVHLALDLLEEGVKLTFLVGKDLFQEDLVFLNDRLVVGKVLLFDQMVKNPAFLVFESNEELFNAFSASETCRSSLVELRGEFTDATLLLSWALIDLWFDDTLGDGFSDLDQHVGQAFKTPWILG